VPWPAGMRFEDDSRAPGERGGLIPPRPATRVPPRKSDYYAAWRMAGGSRRG
jgi:hypothetical protein